MVEARRRHIPVIPRGELLAELMRLKFGIAVAGSHGKTTTTSMVAAILSTPIWTRPSWSAAGRRASAARTPASARAIIWWSSRDESDGSFLKLSPILAVVTNIDREHLDHYTGGIEEIRGAFATFVNKVPFYGAAILCLDDENIQQILPQHQPPGDHLRHQRAGRRCTINAAHLRPPGQRIPAFATATRIWASFALHVPGMHNGAERDRRHRRGAGARHSARDRFAKRLTEFQRRRPALPTARAKRGDHGDRRLRPSSHRDPRDAGRGAPVPLQADPRALPAASLHPHDALMDDFARSFNDADTVYLLDIYAASEKPIEGVTAQVAGRAAGLVRPQLGALLRHHRRGASRP